MRCLIVCDSIPSKNIIKDSINRIDGFSGLSVAINVESAVQNLKKFTFDLVILDINSPKDANMSLLKWIRAKDVNVGVVFICSENTMDFVRQAFGYGVCDYLIKPFSHERLQEAIARAIGRRTYLGEFKYLSQDEIDRFIDLNVLKVKKPVDSKGISTATFSKIEEAIQGEDGKFTAKQLSNKTGLSRITVRRYLERMVVKGILGTDLVYGEIGRPQKVYNKKSFKDE